MSASAQVRAWRPAVRGVVEVLHAYFPSHAYPSHTHDAWAVLIVDEGVIRYDLDHREHGLTQAQVSLLPPNVPHDGRSVRPEGFRKRVLYLEPDRLGDDVVGAAVDRPEFVDPVLRTRLHQLHGVLADGREEFEAESRLTLIEERLRQQLRNRVVEPPDRRDAGVARRLREVLDGRPPAEVAGLAGFYDQSHLNRHFRKMLGVTPSQFARS